MKYIKVVKEYRWMRLLLSDLIKVDTISSDKAVLIFTIIKPTIN